MNMTNEDSEQTCFIKEKYVHGAFSRGGPLNSTLRRIERRAILKYFPGKEPKRIGTCVPLSLQVLFPQFSLYRPFWNCQRLFLSSHCCGRSMFRCVALIAVLLDCHQNLLWVPPQLWLFVQLQFLLNIFGAIRAEAFM